MGTRLEGVGQHDREDGEECNDERSDSGFDNLLCDIPETGPVGLVVAFVNGKVKSIGTVDLDVYQAGAVTSRSALRGNEIAAREGTKPEDVPAEVHNLLWPFFSLEKRPLREITGSAREHGESGGRINLSIQNDASSLINPKILFHQLTVLLRKETICEANETVGRRHPGGKKAGEDLSFRLLK